MFAEAKSPDTTVTPAMTATANQLMERALRE